MAEKIKEALWNSSNSECVKCNSNSTRYSELATCGGLISFLSFACCSYYTFHNDLFCAITTIEIASFKDGKQALVIK